MSIVPVSILAPYNVFLYFLEWQQLEDSKLGIMINVGKCRLVKVIFSNIYKIGDACANSFSRYIMIVQCMRNVFTFYRVKFLRKNDVSGKIKARLPQKTRDNKVTTRDNKVINILYHTFFIYRTVK